MYFPYFHRRNPTNRECRIASILSIIGFIAYAWEMLLPHGSFLPSLGVLALMLFPGWLGLATLWRARPTQGDLWPQITARFNLKDRYPPLDERDTLVRYRTFLTSYQILSVLIWVLVMLPELLGSNINVLTSRHHGPLTLGLMTLSLLMVLTLLLPHWVTPWLESNVTFDAEADLEATGRSGKISEGPVIAARSNRDRIARKVYLWILWILILAVLLMIYNSYVPGFFRAMFH